MLFDYNKQEIFTKTLDVVDVGNFCIRATSENGMEYYAIVKTILGKVGILKFGPMFPDLKRLTEDFTMSYKTINYKENIIFKEINTFINDTKKKITDVEEITLTEVFEALPEIEDSIKEM